MKNILFLLAIITTVAITSCSSDDEDSASTLLGTWEISAFTAQCSMANMSLSESAQNGCIDIDGDQLCISMTFQENGAGNFTTTADGDTDMSTFTYTITDNEVNICDGGECNIASLNNNSLTVEAIEEGCDVAYVFKKR